MGVLHTSSFKADENINASFPLRSEANQRISLNFLMAEEQKLYQAFGCDNYKDFLEKIKGLFTPGNIEVIKNFQPAVLNKKLERFRGGRGELYEEKVNFTFDIAKIDDINFKIDALKTSDFIISTQGDKITLGFKYNTSTVKTILRDLYKDRHFIPKSESLTALNARLVAITGNDGFLTITTENPDTGIFDQEFKLSPIPNFPWGCTKKIYEEAVKEGRTDILNEFKRAGEMIKDFIFNELCEGASPELKTAIKWTWYKNFSAADRDPAFFFQGTTSSNFISAVQGSLGEFQAAVIFTFLQQTIKNTQYAKILGDKLKNGEQLKTDISIIKNLGLQVKNINTFENALKNTQLIRDLETTIHPNKLSQYLDNGQGFLDFIANYYFNTTYAGKNANTFNMLIAYLGTYLGELMNLAMDSSVTDTVSFYFIGGKYLVPASSILLAAKELNLKESIKIQSSYKGESDADYEALTHTNSEGRVSPLYVEYWVHPHKYTNKNEWIPTGKNQNIYANLINKDISIKTKFNLFKEIESYALF